MAAFVRRRSGFKGSTLSRGREKLDRAAFVEKKLNKTVPSKQLRKSDEKR